MTPDTAQRRAEAIAIQLCEKWFASGARASWCPAMANDFAQALQQAHRGALAEAAKVARDRALLWKSHGGAKMASPYGHLTVEGECEVIADALDRLREGVEG